MTPKFSDSQIELYEGNHYLGTIYLNYNSEINPEGMREPINGESVIHITNADVHIWFNPKGGKK